MKIEFISSERLSGSAELYVYFDRDGLKYLRDVLDRILNTGSHDHLSSPAWAGKELTIDAEAQDKSYNKVTLSFLD